MSNNSRQKFVKKTEKLSRGFALPPTDDGNNYKGNNSGNARNHDSTHNNNRNYDKTNQNTRNYDKNNARNYNNKNNQNTRNYNNNKNNQDDNDDDNNSEKQPGQPITIKEATQTLSRLAKSKILESGGVEDEPIDKDVRKANVNKYLQLDDSLTQNVSLNAAAVLASSSDNSREAWRFFRQKHLDDEGEAKLFAQERERFIAAEVVKQKRALQRGDIFKSLKRGDDLDAEALYNATQIWNDRGEAMWKMNRSGGNDLGLRANNEKIQLRIDAEKKRLVILKRLEGLIDKQIALQTGRTRPARNTAGTTLLLRYGDGSNSAKFEKYKTPEIEAEIAQLQQISAEINSISETNALDETTIEHQNKKHRYANNNNDDDDDDQQLIQLGQIQPVEKNKKQKLFGREAQLAKLKVQNQQFNADDGFDTEENDFLLRKRDDEIQLEQKKAAQTQDKKDKGALHTQYIKMTMQFVIDNFNRTKQSKVLVAKGEEPLHEYDHFIKYPLDIAAIVDKLGADAEMITAFEWLHQTRGLIWDFKGTKSKEEKIKNQRKEKLKAFDNNSQKSKQLAEREAEVESLNNDKSLNKGFLKLRPITNNDIAYMAKQRTRVLNLERVLEKENKYIGIQNKLTEREQRNKRLTKKTSQGQPVMKHRMKDLLKQVAKKHGPGM